MSIFGEIMAEVIEGTISVRAKCPGCNGAESSHALYNKSDFIRKPNMFGGWEVYALYECTACGSGSLAIWVTEIQTFPEHNMLLYKFMPEKNSYMEIPDNVPAGIQSEFKEADECFQNDCNRAAGSLLRSVLDKTLRANGYSGNRENLFTQIEAAYEDHIITETRKLNAHDIRLFGNDILHDEWREVSREEVAKARHYCQRILEDFYDNRETVERALIEKGRLETN